MKINRGLLVLAFVALAFVSIASVYAADANDTAVAADGPGDELEIEIQDDAVSDNAADANEEDTISASDEDALSDYEGWGNFTELQKYINDNSIGENPKIDLNKSYRHVDGEPFVITITKPIEIYGYNWIIDGQGVAAIFNVMSDDVFINGVYFRNAHADKGAGIYSNAANLHIHNCVFESCTATNGGAIYIEGKDFKILHNNPENRFWKCSATEKGGAIYLASGATGAHLYGQFQDCYSSDDEKYTSKKGSIYSVNSYTDDGCSFSGTTLIQVKIDSPSKTLMYGLTDELNATLKMSNGTAIAGANLTVTFLNKTENYTTDKNGTIHIKISVLDVGEYPAEFKFVDDVVYTSKSASSKLTVIQATSNVTISPVHYFDFDERIIFEFTVENRTTVNGIIVGENRILAFNLSGNTIEWPYLPMGRYNVTVYNNATSNIRASSDSLNFTVVRASTQIESADVNATYGSVIVIGATLKDVKGKALSGKNAVIELNGKIYRNVTDSNGQATFVISDALASQEYAARVIFDGDVNYTASYNQITVNITRADPVISAEDVTATYTANRDLVITLKDSQGNALSGYNVTVDLNGAKAYVTDTGGQVKIPVGTLLPKTYAVKIFFNGTDNYTSASKDVKVTVNKLKSKIVAKNKKFKKSKKTKKYSVTLKDANSNAIKNVKVTLKVKGKTYKATTNNKGKATFKINKLKKKGKHKATITFNGDRYYEKATKKVKITIK